MPKAIETEWEYYEEEGTWIAEPRDIVTDEPIEGAKIIWISRREKNKEVK